METKYAIVKFDKSDIKTYIYACGDNVNVGDVVSVQCYGYSSPQQALVVKTCSPKDIPQTKRPKYLKHIIGVLAKQDYAPKFLSSRVRYTFSSAPYLKLAWHKIKKRHQLPKYSIKYLYTMVYKTAQLNIFGNKQTFLIVCNIDIADSYTLTSEILCTDKYEFGYTLNRLKNNLYMYFNLTEHYHFKDLEKMIKEPNLYDW